jgi:hypothetical protein
MVSWLGDGGINGIQTGSFFPSDTAYILAGPGGMVDVNGGLRLQYNLHKDLFIDEAIYDSIGLDDRITARANIRYVNADFTAYPGRRMTLTMFVADAALFPEGDVPTPFQVLAQGNNLQVYRANKSYAEPSDRSFTLRGPRAGQLNPGTKYWVLVLPTSITDMSTTPSTVNDISIGSPNIHGRGLSRSGHHVASVGDCRARRLLADTLFPPQRSRPSVRRNHRHLARGSVRCSVAVRASTFGREPQSDMD